MNRLAKLLLSLTLDALGFMSLFAGEFADFVWAPLSALVVGWLYRRDGYTFLAFAEEILPGFDFIPTATLAWLDENGFLNFLHKEKR
ncbi:hypothetical protein HYV43_01570 [Candidatus Micrarchaeota archaeon]|nr:hypothetical protein [Candidatus Micrarchaeota archaeon]